jgi:hypothetical protein
MVAIRGMRTLIELEWNVLTFVTPASFGTYGPSNFPSSADAVPTSAQSITATSAIADVF